MKFLAFEDGTEILIISENAPPGDTITYPGCVLGMVDTLTGEKIGFLKTDRQDLDGNIWRMESTNAIYGHYWARIIVTSPAQETLYYSSSGGEYFSGHRTAFVYCGIAANGNFGVGGVAAPSNNLYVDENAFAIGIAARPNESHFYFSAGGCAVYASVNSQNGSGLYYGLQWKNNLSKFEKSLKEKELPPPDTDPYNPGGNTDTGGGGGSFQRPSTPVPFPDIPGLSAVDSGFVKIFSPTSAQLNSLATYLWSDLFDIDTFKKLFANPMDCILGLSIVPFPVPKSPAQSLKVGNIDTGISLDVANGQFFKFDMGTITVNEYFKSYLDYSPFTKIDIYLPFVGTRPLDADEVMGKALKVEYMVDILSGACVAGISAGTSVLYTFSGQCSASVPVAASDHSGIIQNAISIAGQIGSAVATGGLSTALTTAASVAGTVAASKTRTEKSGAFSGYASLMGIRAPYLIFSTPRQAVAAYQNTYDGYPGFITQQLNTLSGYTQVEKIHLEKVPATSAELSEIEGLLKEGVII